ncbi:MAG: trypsin-like peptidase domain-containing protein [Chromatiales bacterium]|nr:trypsin-like peptidase domain-containing protein [Chromatiales bacterium]
MPALLRVLCLLAAWTVPLPAVAQEVVQDVVPQLAGDAPFADEAKVSAGPAGGDAGSAPPAAEPGAGEEPDGAGEPEVDLGPVSAAGQRMLDRVRGSVVQVRGFYGTNRSEAFHGSAFAVGPGGVLVTNYHVIARAALNPRDYRLEYHAEDGQVGTLTILAIDVVRDLAVIRAEGLEIPPLPLRTSIPPKGDRAYAVGYPLQLGLVITEGIANGRLDNEYGAKLHYAGPMNPGMSGGPAVDSKGRVFGVNVSISTRGQLISFLVPAEFVGPLLQLASTPLVPGDARKEVSRQLRGHQAAVLAALPATFPTQTSAGYALPAELTPFVDCTAAVGAPPSKGVLLQSVNCRASASVSVQPGLQLGDFQFSHQVMVARDLHPLQFGAQLRKVAAAVRPTAGAAQHVTPFACKADAVNLNRFKAAVTLCARSYRNYDGLYDLSMVVVSLNHPEQGFVSSLNIRGMDYAGAMEFAGRYLGAMRWTQ